MRGMIISIKSIILSHNASNIDESTYFGLGKLESKWKQLLQT